MARSKSSHEWMQRHINDPYVKKAQAEGMRSRAVYKLKEIQDKHHLMRPGMTVIDLGAAPGSWSVVAAKLLKGKGELIALDLLEMEPIEGVTMIQGDFTDDAVYEDLLSRLGESSVDVVLSDMSPNISGIKHSDQLKMMGLADMTLEFALKVLKPSGYFLVKVFQGVEFDQYLKIFRQSFQKVSICKPKASRDESREVYLLGKSIKKAR